MVSKELYLKALALTAIVFAVTISVSFYLDEQRFSIVREQIDLANAQADDSRLGLLYVQSFRSDPGFCPAFGVQLETVASNLDKLRTQLSRFGEASKLRDLELLKRQYARANAELWLYSINYKHECPSDRTTVLYFYPDSVSCPDCEAQARVLDGLKSKCGQKLMVFSLPSDLDLGIVNSMKAQFSVDRTPALVINEQTILEGLSSERQVLASAPGLAKCAAE